MPQDRTGIGLRRLKSGDFTARTHAHQRRAAKPCRAATPKQQGNWLATTRRTRRQPPHATRRSTSPPSAPSASRSNTGWARRPATSPATACRTRTTPTARRTCLLQRSNLAPDLSIQPTARTPRRPRLAAALRTAAKELLHALGSARTAAELRRCCPPRCPCSSSWLAGTGRGTSSRPAAAHQTPIHCERPTGTPPNPSWPTSPHALPARRPPSATPPTTRRCPRPRDTHPRRTLLARPGHHLAKAESAGQNPRRVLAEIARGTPKSATPDHPAEVLNWRNPPADHRTTRRTRPSRHGRPHRNTSAGAVPVDAAGTTALVHSGSPRHPGEAPLTERLLPTKAFADSMPGRAMRATSPRSRSQLEVFGGEVRLVRRSFDGQAPPWSPAEPDSGMPRMSGLRARLSCMFAPDTATASGSLGIGQHVQLAALLARSTGFGPSAIPPSGKERRPRRRSPRVQLHLAPDPEFVQHHGRPSCCSNIKSRGTAFYALMMRPIWRPARSSRSRRAGVLIDVHLVFGRIPVRPSTPSRRDVGVPHAGWSHRGCGPGWRTGLCWE